MYVGERELNNETLQCREPIRESIVSVAIENRERMEEILSVLQCINRTISIEGEPTKGKQENVECLADEVKYQRELTIEILQTAAKIKAMLGG